MELDLETSLRTKLPSARILIKLKGQIGPNVINILAGARCYELQFWWEISPLVVYGCSSISVFVFIFLSFN